MDIKAPATVDEYIAQLTKEKSKLLKQIRVIVKEMAPDAMEVISFRMPAYKQNGMLLFFAAHKNHIGFYPGISAVEAYKKKLEQYKTSKGTIQFPLDSPLPLELIKEIVAYRVNENLLKKKKK